MQQTRFKLIAIVLLTGFIFWGCREQSTQRQSGLTSDNNQENRQGKIKITLRNVGLWVEVADQPAARERGLMFRKNMPEDESMLFVFEYPQMQSFWMRNTYLPLDIAFVAQDGRIINILQMKPLDEDPKYRSASQALYVIEANQGWFEKHGINAGDTLKFKQD